jgi:hypothetical protein
MHVLFITLMALGSLTVGLFIGFAASYSFFRIRRMKRPRYGFSEPDERPEYRHDPSVDRDLPGTDDKDPFVTGKMNREEG